MKKAVLLAIACTGLLFSQKTKETGKIIDSGLLTAESGALKSSKTSSGDTEIVETVVVDPSKKKQLSTGSVMNSGNKIGMKLGFNYILGLNPGLVQGYYVEVPFADFAAVQFDASQNIITSLSNDGVTNTYTEKRYVEISGQTKFYLGSVSIGVGLVYDRFVGGSINTEYSPGGNTYSNVTISSSPDLLSAIISIGYLAEIKENIFVFPSLGVSYQLIPWSFPNQMLAFNLTLAIAFKM